MAAAAEAQITKGALNAIFNDPHNLQRDFPVPVCQCVQIKPMQSAGEGAQERYRLVLSDIQNFVQCMLATQANHVIHEGKLKKGCFVRLKAYQANIVKGKNILIIMDIEVIESLGELEKIGEPTNLPVKEEEDGKPSNTTIAGSGFYGNKPQPDVPEKTLPSRTNGLSSSASHGNIYPIEALSPYMHRWTIKARVTHKSAIKTWHNANGEGKLFSVNLLDESGEIKATGFKDQCDMLYDMFQEGTVYYISAPCRVGMAKKQFSNLSNEYELTFERDTAVEKAEDQDNVPQVRYNFTNIGAIQDVEKDSTIDVIGVLHEVADVTEIVSKATHQPFQKRELTLVDDSGYSIRLTVWGKTATAFEGNPEDIVAFKGAKVGDFGGRSLSLLSSGSMTMDPDIPEAHKLKGWYDSQGRGDNFMLHTATGVGSGSGRREVTKTIGQVLEENLGSSDNADYFSLKSTVVRIKQDRFAYAACLKPGCNKKVVDNGDGTWRCESCNTDNPKPEYRYIMSFNVCDHTGQLWLTCFDDVGRIIMGMSADETMNLQENDTLAMERAFEKANWKEMIFKVRAKTDTFQEQQRVRYQVIGANLINYVTEASKLADQIKLYNLD